jgi:peptide/nickel transport system ATP-binding protein
MTDTHSQHLLHVQDLNIDISRAGHLRSVVRSCNFSLESGKTLCIVGESGCGKSLTALSLLDLLPQAATRRVATMRFSGIDLTGLGARELAQLHGSRIAMIFQDPMTSLNPVFTVGTLLTDVLMRHRPVTRREARDRAIYLLQRVGISDAQERLNQYPFELSGGLRQRVMIAMALMCGPELLIADEPTTALDVTVQAELLELLRDIQREFGLGMLFISHDLGLVAKLADDIIVMYAGDIVEAGPAKQVLGDPQHPYTQLLLRCIPRPGQTPPRSELASITGSVPSLDTAIQGCSFYDRCPVREDRCGKALPVPPMGLAHRCLCIKPGAMRVPAEVSA